MAKKDSRRYFKKREDHGEKIVENKLVESVDSVLPHNSVTIPASKFYSFFKFSIYASILFGVLSIAIFTFLLPSIRESSPSYRLIYYPSAAESHLNYLEWLVTHYRLEDARREIGYLNIAQKASVHSDFDSSRYDELTGMMRSREEDFRKIVSEYAFWHSTLSLFPGYRDGLYRSSQLAYRLFNEDESVSKLRTAVDLDPQFIQGREVLQQIQNEDP